MKRSLWLRVLAFLGLIALATTIVVVVRLTGVERWAFEGLLYGFAGLVWARLTAGE